MSLTFAPSDSPAIPLILLDQDGFDAAFSGQPDRALAWAKAQGFTGALGQVLTVPGPDGSIETAFGGFGTAGKRARGRFPLAAVAAALPAGTYRLASDLPAGDLETECLGWLLSAYSFTTYSGTARTGARLVAPDGIDAARVETLAAGEALTRDMINTPASDFGPAALEAAARDVAEQFGASCVVTTGDDLLAANFPMIHTVGRAASQPPRLIDMSWGTSGPKLTLVGKGVCFDTGGLNLKPGASMGLMKKDMGGAATVLGLAHDIMALQVPVRLRVLIPAVENAVAGEAFRPGDILTSRKGLTVEINNTDAEGRLVLADALALAEEDQPDLIVSMATLTGAARVAVGQDLAPFYVDDTRIAQALAEAADRVCDPVWRMPFHDPYEPLIEPGIADLDNAPAGGFAGSITAALFLRRFVTKTPYMHFDIYGWCKSGLPARSKGGVGMGARALLEAMPQILDL
ncbi:MAG: leucyl aminopeptidase family protein [Pseudomonadota bacterium]